MLPPGVFINLTIIISGVIRMDRGPSLYPILSNIGLMIACYYHCCVVVVCFDFCILYTMLLDIWGGLLLFVLMFNCGSLECKTNFPRGNKGFIRTNKTKTGQVWHDWKSCQDKPW